MSFRNNMEFIFGRLSNKGKQRRDTVQFALEIFNDGIEEYYKDTLRDFHTLLINQTQHLRGFCNSGCSKNKSDLSDWCPNCSTWRTAILSHHRSRTKISKTFDWKTVDSSKWPSATEEIVKIFRPSWFKVGHDADDISVRLNVMTNCTYFGNYLQLCQLRDMRNDIAHGNSISHATKRVYLKKLEGFLNMNELNNYVPSVESLGAVKVLHQWNCNEIIENNLIEEDIRSYLEKKLHRQSKKTHTCRYLFLCLPVLIIAIGITFTMSRDGVVTKDQRESFSNNVIKSYRESTEMSDCERLDSRDTYYFKIHSDYTGRQWLKDRVMAKLRNTDGVIVIAEPGFGKSAFISNFLLGYNDTSIPLLGFHICQHDSPQSTDSSKFTQQLALMLRCRLEKYAKTWEVKKNIMDSIFNECHKDSAACFQELIAKHLLEIRETDQRLLFVIDGLDECHNSWVGKQAMPIAILLTKYHERLRPFIKILITSRNESSLISRFRFLDKLHTFHDSAENKEDMKKYLEIKRNCSSSALNNIIEKTSFNFLILKYYSTHLKKNCESSDLDRIPTSLLEMYDVEFRRLYGDTIRSENKIDRSFFEILISNQLITESLTREVARDLLKYSDLPLTNELEFEELLRRIQPHLIRVADDSRIYFIHNSLKDWFADGPAPPLYVDIDRGHYTWIRYFHNRLVWLPVEQVVRTLDLENITCGIQESITLSIHFTKTKNESLKKELTEGHVKIPDRMVKIILQTIDNFTEVYNQIGYAVLFIDNFTIIKTLVSLSKTNDVSREAHHAANMGNINSLKALISTGLVNLKAKHPVTSTWMLFNTQLGDLHSNDMSEYVWRDVQRKGPNIQSVNQLHALMTNTNLSDSRSQDYFTLVHSLIHMRSMEGIKYVLSFDKSLVYDLTTDGWDVFELATLSDNPEIFDYLKKLKPLQQESWYLLLASKASAFYMVRHFLLSGLKDYCPDCKSNLVEVSANHFITLPSHVEIWDNSSFSKVQALKLSLELMCTTALMAAVQSGDVEVVLLLLEYGTDCMECKNALGMTPLAAAIFHKHESVINVLLDRGADTKFTVSSTSYFQRARLVNKHFLLPYQKELSKHNLLEGANLIHLASLRPTCAAAKPVIKLAGQNPGSLESLDMYGRTPLYYSLCHPDADNTYDTLAKFLSPRAHRMVFFLVEAIRKDVYDSHLLDLNANKLLLDSGLCGLKVQEYSRFYIISNDSIDICMTGLEMFPKLKDFVIVNHPELKVMHYKLDKNRNTGLTFGLQFKKYLSSLIAQYLERAKICYGVKYRKFLGTTKFPNASSIIRKIK